MRSVKRIEQDYAAAKARYAEMKLDTDAALAALEKIPVSIHCWQGDDVGGFEKDAGGTSGGILSTGNYPGRARNAAELRMDLDKAFSLIPGAKRLNLHAIYLDTDKAVDRNKITPEHFRSWIDWAKARKTALDFNPSYFGHPKAASNLTLSSPDAGIRRFWIEHGIACRKIAAALGAAQGSPCIMNTWIPDGFKDVTVDRGGARRRLIKSLDAVFAEKLPATHMRDAVESKLFGIGVETCTVGSNEFYLGYAVKNSLLLCLDAGHFHPTEVISDKISAVLLFLDEILLHVSRPVRWDSDHVVLFDDELQAIAREIIRNGVRRVHIGLDYFDATINRIAAWAIGSRNMQKALLAALLEPSAELVEMEKKFSNSRKLALTEELKMLPLGAVYDYFCLRQGVPVSMDYMDEIELYEKQIQSKRS
ncbi:MAG: L-rhamnose isomerase [Lentisphaerae bacterium ADurb.Bin242]|nr:MAG: L-rhamnose isomerase [Lentisphaerae bacterium ADurb.Bin242]